MKKINNLLLTYKSLISRAVLILLLLSCSLKSYAQVNSDLDLDIYNVDPRAINDFDVIEKGNIINLTVESNISSLEPKNKSIQFNSKANEGNFKATGFTTKSIKGGRFSRFGTLEFSTDKLILDNGQEVNCSATSPIFKSIHSPHSNNNGLNLARTISTLSFSVSPLTLGTSLGISFLASGVLSLYQNGIHDFVWGGLSGSGLSFIEGIFRRQPDLLIGHGETIPFILKEDLKINKGIQKEKFEPILLSKEKALKKIETLLKWGDLSGALEIAAKTGQKEKYDEIIKKVSGSQDYKVIKSL